MGDKEFIFRRLETKCSVKDNIITFNGNSLAPLVDTEIDEWVGRTFGNQFRRYVKPWLLSKSRNGVYCIYTNGTYIWFYKNEIHKNRGPAIETDSGSKMWYKNGRLNRGGDRPAIVRADGRTEWWVNGQRHREDGPALITKTGDEEWFYKGVKHRIDGPAVIHKTLPFSDEYWIKGTRLTKEEFNNQ